MRELPATCMPVGPTALFVRLTDRLWSYGPFAGPRHAAVAVRHLPKDEREVGWTTYELVTFGGVGDALSICLGVSVMLLLADGWAFVLVGVVGVLHRCGWRGWPWP